MNEILSAFAGEDLYIDPALQSPIPEIQEEKAADGATPTGGAKSLISKMHGSRAIGFGASQITYGLLKPNRALEVNYV